MLSVWEAAGLRVVCKALKVLVMGWPMHLGEELLFFGGSSMYAEEKLGALLTCFPATEGVTIMTRTDHPLPRAEEHRLVELLRQHGEMLKRVRPVGMGAMQLLWAATRAGALPNLTYIMQSFRDPAFRQVLSGGMLGRLEEVQILSLKPDDEEQLAALEHLRHLQHLRRLSLQCTSAQKTGLVFGPFIPPRLKSLILESCDMPTLEALLRELPSMLQSSGASLEAIEIKRVCGELSPEGAAAIARVLQACSSTLKTVKLLSVRRVLSIASQVPTSWRRA
jgi:hypothetical protein